MNSLIAALPWPRAVRAHAPTHPLSMATAVDVLLAESPSPDDDQFSRCGWFDSSLDLADGLQVIEYADQLPEDLAVEGLVWPARGS